MRILICASALVCSLFLAACYSVRPSSGAGKGEFKGERRVNVNDVAVPSDYRVDVVAQGLTFPTGIAFDRDGSCFVVESGYSYGEKWTTPRLLKIDRNGELRTIAAGGNNGPWNGVVFHDGSFYVAEGGVLEGGRILRITTDGKITALVSNLPSFGDHHTDGPAVGPDGRIYFGQGTASNSGIIGEDNAKFGWLKRHPRFHDIPGQDIVLNGQNFKTKDVLRHQGHVQTGGFVPFGTATSSGQVIKGSVPCSGSVMSISPNGSDLQLVAWGFRNPYGLAFSQDGKLFVTDNGYDDRGSRPVWGTSDMLWQVNKGIWYGWPDYTGDESLTDKDYQPPFKKRLQPLIANPPNKPPAPIARLGVHAAATGLDFSRNTEFGHVGEAFIALFGDEAPTTGKVLHPVGCKVVRVNTRTGVIEDFMVNKGRENGPASMIGRNGIERPTAVRFSPDGRSLYVVDFGVMNQDRSGAKPRTGTGVIWRITRDGGTQ